NRSFNIERLLFDGAQMTTLAQSENSIAPKLPAYVADGSNLLETSGKLLSSASSEATFSAEFNFKDSATTKVAIDYVDADNYSFVELKLGEKTITLNQVVNGVSTLKGSGTIVKNYDPAVWHSLRVAQRDNKVDVYFDNLQKITNASLTATGGKIGYLTSATIGYTAFSNVGKGLSDVLEVKQAHEIIPASLYSNDPALSSGVSLTPASGKYVNTSLAGLTFEGNKATYLVNFKDDGLYGLQLTYPKEDAGKKIGVRIDDGTVYKVTLPNIDTTDTLIRTRIADFNIVNGINQVRLENVGESVHFQNLSFFKASPNTPLFAHNLMTYLDTGADYKTIWKLHEDGHRATAGTRQLVYLGDTTITDFTLEVDMKFIGSTATSTAGIIFHADNASFSQHDSYTSMQGYYVSLNNNEVRLEKLNYSADRLGTKIGANPSATVLHLKVVVRGGLYTVFVNDVKAIEVSDSLPFTHGRLGFYTNGAEVTYKNLSITA
ncbi:MAG: DUF1080 domain-containing protein, partial [Bacillales bacterium]|nr:DUF1080 domain-containing protein [Bacillales bacterium]